MESDIRYYRRRACEEMAAASRAVTEAARERRLQLVDVYIQHLRDLKAPSPFAESPANRRSVLAWQSDRAGQFSS